MEEKEVKCPKNTKWLEGMARVLPQPLWGKLRPYIEKCVLKK